jgi:hypothetical protein
LEHFGNKKPLALIFLIFLKIKESNRFMEKPTFKKKVI